jgi:hypothetical protein
VLVEAPAEEIVFEHRRERRSDAHRQGEGNALARHAIERVEERQVALDEGLVEPALLEVTRVFRVAHPRKVGVKNKT